MSCYYPDTFEIARNATYGAFKESLSDELACRDTYLRPKSANTLMPWLYALFLLLLHLPACFIRAVRWESAQYLALALAILGIALTLQAYQSTQLKPEEILVWMPLTLILDVGAMMQMDVLILEKHGFWCLWWALKDALLAMWKSCVTIFTTCLPEKDECGVMEVSLGDKEQQQHTEVLQTSQQPIATSKKTSNCTVTQIQEESDLESQRAPRESFEEDALRHSIVAIIAFALLLMLIALQLYGLNAAVHSRNKRSLKAQWCSPSFRDFSIALTTGNCKLYPILEDLDSGIGCIELSAEQQREWIIGTIIALVAALACQVGDMVLLKWTQHDSRRKCRGTVRLQRPWLTMFGGVTMLIILIAFGVFSANRLPSGVTDMVWVYRKEPDKAVGRVCQGRLKSPGLRGTIIAYTDGLFGSWGGVYFGKYLD